MIEDAQARATAEAWWEGAGALSMLARTGATHAGPHRLTQLLAEIGGHQAGTTRARREWRELGDLHDYVTAVGSRGPVTGWAQLPKATGEDPWVSAYTAAGAALHAAGWAVHVDGGAGPAGTWQGSLTRDGHPIMDVICPDGDPARCVRDLVHRLTEDKQARPFFRAARTAGADPVAAMTGLAHLDRIGGAGSASSVTAIFLYEGFRDWVDANDPGQQLLGSVGGAIEQAHLMQSYAPVVDTAAALAFIESGQVWGWAGVMEYEVINPVGSRLAERASQRVGRGAPASPAAVAALTRALALAFAADAATPPANPTGAAIRAAHRADLSSTRSTPGPSQGGQARPAPTRPAQTPPGRTTGQGGRR